MSSSNLSQKQQKHPSLLFLRSVASIIFANLMSKSKLISPSNEYGSFISVIFYKNICSFVLPFRGSLRLSPKKTLLETQEKKSNNNNLINLKYKNTIS